MNSPQVLAAVPARRFDAPPAHEADDAFPPERARSTAGILSLMNLRHGLSA
jgi:hypothetical protein